MTALAAFAAGATGAVLASPAPAHATHQAAGSAAAAGRPVASGLPSTEGAHPGQIVLTRSGGRHTWARHRARQMMHHRFHWSVRKQYRYLSRLWDRESGWNRYAYNPYSGAYGIPQALPGSKMSSAGPHWRYCVRTQEKWGMRYIRSRYGTPHGAWRHWLAYGWY
ncbi:MAG TPA: lytic transglycosylase domain-containing protein [Streptosporangiaceae bacterium]